MPVYEYLCSKCNARVTIRRSFADASPAVCPECGGDELHRLPARFSVVTSGSERIRDVSWIDRDIARRFGK
jgi:putative FmdB family regulatory protein